MLIKLPKADVMATTEVLPKVEKSIFTRVTETRKDDLAASFRKVFDDEGKEFEDKRTKFLDIMNDVNAKAQKVEDAYKKYHEKRKTQATAIKTLAAMEAKTGKSIVGIVKSAASGDAKKIASQAKAMAKAGKAQIDLIEKAKEGRKAVQAEKTMVIEALHALQMAMAKFK